MDPVAIIVAALAEGAVAPVLEDAYMALKALILGKFGDEADVKGAVERVENRPDSDARQAVLKEELENAGAAQDDELVQAAQTLLNLLKQQGLSGDVSYQAELRGSGAIAQGPGATAAGAGGVAVGGDVHGGIQWRLGHENVGLTGPNVPSTATRHTDIACPRQVWVSRPRVSVIIRLTVDPPAHSDRLESLELKEELAVRVRLEAPSFDFLNEREQETIVLPKTDSPPLIFDLRPRQVGHSRITFDFFQSGNPVGTASMPVEITAHKVDDETERRQGLSLRMAPNATSPDLTLYIAYERFQAQPALVFTLIRAGEVGRTFHPVYLEGDPKAHVGRLYESLTDLTDRIDPTTKITLGQEQVLPSRDAERRLKQIGQNLWRDLIPSDLKVAYSKERETWRDQTLLIVSDEPYMPWELVWPYAAGDWEDDMPWCMSLRLTRWLRRDAQGNGNEGPPSRLRLGTMACLSPTDSYPPLPGTLRERDFLIHLMQKHRLQNMSPDVPTWPDVMRLLEAGGYDWLHVAAHGSFYSDSPDADSAIWLQDERPLSPTAIVGAAVEGHIRRRRPAFVFNNCHSGRQGWAVTRLGGWASRLIGSGSGLFLAPLWIVNDESALDFAKTFYHELLVGQSVAQAVRQGRLAARRAGDPTYLAYSVYAHPNARVQIAAVAEDS